MASKPEIHTFASSSRAFISVFSSVENDHGLLCLCDAVREYDCYCTTRNSIVALAPFSGVIHDGFGLDGRLSHLPRWNFSGILNHPTKEADRAAHSVTTKPLDGQHHRCKSNTSHTFERSVSRALSHRYSRRYLRPIPLGGQLRVEQ